MGRGLKFIGVFFVFLFTGILIAGIAAGNLEVNKEVTTSLNTHNAWEKLSDTANLKVWISHLQSIVPDEIPGTYKIFLKTGKPQSAEMKMLPEADSTNLTASYRISNKGSELNILFKVKPNKVDISYTVEGKGVANRIVLSMLKKSLKEQYHKEISRIEKLLNP